MKNFKYLLFITVLELFCLFGDYFIKKATIEKHKYWYLFGAMIIYALSAIGWFEVMKNYKFLTSNIFHAIGSLVVGILLGVFVFKERISWNEGIGIAFAVLSFYFLAKE